MDRLIVKNISKSFGRHKILTKISCTAAQGATTAFLGPNGTGKTTLLKIIMGLHLPTLETTTNQIDAPHIYLDQKEITDLPVHKRVEHGLVYLPQHLSLFEQMTVEQNLLLIYHYHAHWYKQPFYPFAQEMDKLLTLTELSQKTKQYVYKLSGGQKRKVELVRALLMQPKVILFDEPFAGVDPKSIYELKKIFVDMTKNNISVIISDHNVDQLLSIATTIYVIINGTIVTSGNIEAIMKNSSLKEQYLGSQFHAEVAKRFLHKGD